MPDPINNPGGPARDVESVLDVTRKLQSAASDLNKMTPGFRAIENLAKVTGDILGQIEKTSERITKRWGEFGSELRRTVALSDDIEDSFKALADYHRKMTQQGMKTKDLESYKKVLEEMYKTTKDISSKGLFSKGGSRLITKQIKEIESAMRGLRTKTQATFSSKEAEDLYVQIEKINRSTVQLAKNMKGVKLSHLGREVSGAEKAVRHLLSPFGTSQSSRIDKVYQYAQTGHEIREARRKKDAGRFKEFEEHRAHILRRLPSLNIDVSRYTRSDGTIDKEKLNADRARRSETIQSIIKGRAQEHGLSPFATRLMTQSALAKANGTREDLLTRAGMGLLAHGEGSIGRGLLSWGGSMMEGGAGGLAEMTGMAAAPIALMAIVKSAFDKNQKMNADVVEKLGQGGIFGGQNDSITSLANVRGNLNSGGLYNRFGIGYEKNLQLAQALVEGGFSISNLADGRVGSTQGFLNNSFGTMQRNAYVYGKLAGLSPSETMAETIKLITQYRQSLGSTEDFFVKIAHDTRAAGISTMKYIQLIDDVNSHYDRSNKLLMTTITIMSNLSKTGRDTAEDISDAMNAVTNGGKPQTFENSAFLNMQAMRNPEERQRILGIRKYNFQDAAEKAAAALGVQNTKENPGAVQDWIDRLQRGGYGSFISLQRQADERFSKDPTKHKAAIASLRTAQTAYTQFSDQQYADSLARQGQFAKAGLAMASTTQNMGPDVVSNSTETLNALLEALTIAHATMGDYLDKNRRPFLDTSPAFAVAKQHFGLDQIPDDRQTNLLETAAASMLQTVTEGIDLKGDPHVIEAKRDLYKKIYQSLAAQGVNLGTNKDTTTAVIDYATKHKDEFMDKILNSKELTGAIYGSADFEKINNAKMTKADNDRQMEDAAKLAASTRTTADVFADAFSYLFTKLQTPLDDISRVIDAAFGHFLKNPWASQSDVKLAEQFNNTGVTDKWREARQKEIDDLEKKLDSAPEDQKSAILSQLDAKKDEFDKLLATSTIFAAGKGVHKDEMSAWVDDMQKYLKNAQGTAFALPKSQADITKDLSFLQDAPKDPFHKNTSILTGAEEAPWDSLLKSLQKIGAIKLNKYKDSLGGDMYTVTTTYNNVNFGQYGKGVTPVNKANQTPPAPTPAGSSSHGTKQHGTTGSW